MPYIFTYFIELLKEPCIVNFHVESENTFEMLNKMKKNDFGHFSDDVCKNKIKKMLTIHRVRFILDKNREVNELENEKTKKNAVKMSGEIPLRKVSPSWHSIQDNVVRRKGKLIVADPSKAVKSEFHKQQMRRKYSDSSEDNQF